MAIGTNAILKAVVEQTHPAGATVLNVHIWKTNFTGSETEAQVIADLKAHLDSMYGEVDQLCKTTYTFDLYRYYERVGTNWNLIGTNSPVYTCSAIGNSMPSGCCMVVRAYTGDGHLQRKPAPVVKFRAQT